MTSVFVNFADTFNVSPTCYRGYIIQGIVIWFWGRGNRIGREGANRKKLDDQDGMDDLGGFFSDLFDGDKAIARAAYIVHSIRPG